MVTGSRVSATFYVSLLLWFSVIA